jgi:hypothetical protein
MQRTLQTADKIVASDPVGSFPILLIILYNTSVVLGKENTMNIQTIGEVAGLVWNFLQSNGKSTLRVLEKEVDASPDLVQMAVGWLAREGKVEIEQEKRSIKVWLADT